MSNIRPPRRAKLIVGLLSSDADLFDAARRSLEDHFGPTDHQSAQWPFSHTDFYLAEMGDDIQRTFLSFAELISVERLAELKRLTNEIEKRFCTKLGRPDSLRPINIDPGYVGLTKLVLATTKDASHRIYIQAGIYAEVTLRFVSGAWETSPWTYPDFADTIYHEFFSMARNRLKQQLNDA
jgi:uncharacterized protein DUF4416